MSSMRCRALVVGVALCALPLTIAFAKLPSEAPALPPPSGAYTIVNVSNVTALRDACLNLTNNTAIIVAAGTYDLTTLVGSPQWLEVGQSANPSITNVQIRGASGNPADVVIRGGGLSDSNVLFALSVKKATNVLVADVTLRDAYFHDVFMLGDAGAGAVRLYHCKLLDAGQEIVKATTNSTVAVPDVVIEYCTIGYAAGAPTHPDAGICLGGGIEGRGLQNWIVRDNELVNIYCVNGALAGSAVRAWSGGPAPMSSGTLVERNTIVNCGQGVSLGVSANQHVGGIVRNNFVRFDPAATYAKASGIFSASNGSKILQNTILKNGTSAFTVDLRWLTSHDVHNNLLDGTVQLRDGATASLSGNVTTAQPSWFVNESIGDLHLVGTAAGAIDQVTKLADAPEDFDATSRPAASGQTDVGGDERPTLVAVDEGMPSEGSWIGPAQPNPMRQSTSLAYESRRSGRVLLQVFDVTGRRVRHLDYGMHGTGRDTATWDGRNAAGDRMPAGIYFLRMEVAGQTRMQKVSVVK